MKVMIMILISSSSSPSYTWVQKAYPLATAPKVSSYKYDNQTLLIQTYVLYSYSSYQDVGIKYYDVYKSHLRDINDII